MKPCYRRPTIVNYLCTVEMIDELNKLLDQHHLKKTAARLKVLEILSKRKVATSQPDLEQIIGQQIDRVTLYRVLSAFEKQGLIHRILDHHGTANYALCSSSCTPEAHRDEHVHFNCIKCQRIFCLDHLGVPEAKLPEGFKELSRNLTYFGTCSQCSG